MSHSTENVVTRASEIIASRDSFPDNPKTGTSQKQTIQPEILVTRLSAKEMSKNDVDPLHNVFFLFR